MAETAGQPGRLQKIFDRLKPKPTKPEQSLVQQEQLPVAASSAAKDPEALTTQERMEAIQQELGELSVEKELRRSSVEAVQEEPRPPDHSLDPAIAYKRLPELSFNDIPEGSGFRSSKDAETVLASAMAEALGEDSILKKPSARYVPLKEGEDPRSRSAHMSPAAIDLIETLGAQEVARKILMGESMGEMERINGSMRGEILVEALKKLQKQYPNLLMIGGGQFAHIFSFRVGTGLAEALSPSRETMPSEPKAARPAVVLINIGGLTEQYDKGGLQVVLYPSESTKQGVIIMHDPSDVVYPSELGSVMKVRKAPTDDVARKALLSLFAERAGGTS